MAPIPPVNEIRLAEILNLINNLAIGSIILPTGSRQLLCNINTIVGLDPMSNLINARYLLGNHPQKKRIAQLLGLQEIDQLPHSDVAAAAEVLVILASTKSGIDPEIISQWQNFRESYVPIIIAIVDLDNGDVDFEDMSAIVGKMLEPVVTPYLVLHSDDGNAAALINLESLKITDSSTGKAVSKESDLEHKELVKEFADELTDALVEGGWDQFVQGLIIPAIPLLPESNLGVEEVKRFLNLIPSRS